MKNDADQVMATLRRVQRRGDTGRAPRWAVETLTLGDYIRFGPPRAGVSPYNCYHVTERGAELMRRPRLA